MPQKVILQLWIPNSSIDASGECIQKKNKKNGVHRFMILPPTRNVDRISVVRKLNFRCKCGDTHLGYLLSFSL